VVPNFETHQPYEDRWHAGTVLAQRLEHFKGRNDIVVLALPRAAAFR
jgi:predicted phosphoribosyltransferase